MVAGSACSFEDGIRQFGNLPKPGWGMVGEKTQITWGKVGSRLGHDGAWFGQATLGQDWSKVGA